MRHRKSRLRLTQKPDHARLLERNLVTSLFLYESIRTTKNRARVIQPIVDRLIATAKTQSTHVAIRTLNAFVTDKNAGRKVMDVFINRYKSRTSGFTTLKAAGARKGDGAALVDLMLIDAELGSEPVAKELPKTQKIQKTQKTQKKSAKSSESSESSASSTSSK